jgi:hypothetical protein
MRFLVIALGLVALGYVLTVVAFATFPGLSLTAVDAPNDAVAFDVSGNLRAFEDLENASAWFGFTGSLVLLAGVAYVAWTSRQVTTSDQLIEVGIVGVGALLGTVASLVLAAWSSHHDSAVVLSAVGPGIWASLALSRALRLHHTHLQEPTTRLSTVPLWLAASAGLFLTAIGTALQADFTDRNVAITAWGLGAVGWALVALALLAARTKGLLGPTAGWTIAGLVAFVASNVCTVTFLVFVSSGTITSVKIEGSLTETMAFVGAVLLGCAAWKRTTELVAANPPIQTAED